MTKAERAKALLESLTPLQGELFPCPRCGHNRMKTPAVRNALSRRAEVYICSECGQEEAIMDALGTKPLELENWAMAQAFDKKGRL